MNEPVNPKPEYVLNWVEVKPELKRFILLHILKIEAKYQYKTMNFTYKCLIDELSGSMGGIVKDQVKIYVDNLIYQDRLHYSENEIKITSKAYEDLKIADKDISSNIMDNGVKGAFLG